MTTKKFFKIFKPKMNFYQPKWLTWRKTKFWPSKVWNSSTNKLLTTLLKISNQKSSSSIAKSNTLKILFRVSDHKLKKSNKWSRKKTRSWNISEMKSCKHTAKSPKLLVHQTILSLRIQKVKINHTCLVKTSKKGSISLKFFIRPRIEMMQTKTGTLRWSILLKYYASSVKTKLKIQDKLKFTKEEKIGRKKQNLRTSKTKISKLLNARLLDRFLKIKIVVTDNNNNGIIIIIDYN